MYQKNRAPPHEGSFDIIEMTLDDLPEVLEIEHLSFNTPWSRDIFLKELHSEFSKVLVAKSSLLEKHKVLGYISLWFVSEEMHILNLACHPRFRRSGVAKSLLEHSLYLSFKIGMKSALLDVRESNYEALSLYKKYGFKPVGVRREYYSDTKEDAIVMLLRMKSISFSRSDFATRK